MNWRFLTLLLVCTSPVLGHDTWVESNTNVIRTGDAVYVDLKLGNHGNNHRDFKLASKIDISGCNLFQTGRNGSAGQATYAIVTLRSLHPGIVRSAFVDGSARSISQTIDRMAWRGLATSRS